MERKNLLYRVVRTFLGASVRIYFKKISVGGAQKIPSRRPAVLVVNHPNSLVDAFLIGTQITERKINFIAKDSIAHFPLLDRRDSAGGLCRN